MSKPCRGVAAMRSLIEKYALVRLIVPTDEMQRTAPFSRCYLPKPPKLGTWTFANDPDTGIFRASDDQLKLVVGGLVPPEDDPALPGMTKYLRLAKGAYEGVLNLDTERT